MTNYKMPKMWLFILWFFGKSQIASASTNPPKAECMPPLSSNSSAQVRCHFENYVCGKDNINDSYNIRSKAIGKDPEDILRCYCEGEHMPNCKDPPDEFKYKTYENVLELTTIIIERYHNHAFNCEHGPTRFNCTFDAVQDTTASSRETPSESQASTSCSPVSPYTSAAPPTTDTDKGQAWTKLEICFFTGYVLQFAMLLVYIFKIRPRKTTELEVKAWKQNGAETCVLSMEENRKQQREIEESEKQSVALETENGAQKEFEELRKKDLEKKIEKMKNEYAEVKNENEELKSEKEELKREKEELKREKKELKRENEELKSEKEELKREKEELKREKKELKREKEELKSEKEELKREKEEHTKDKKVLNAKIKVLKEEIANLKKALQIKYNSDQRTYAGPQDISQADYEDAAPLLTQYEFCAQDIREPISFLALSTNFPTHQITAARSSQIEPRCVLPSDLGRSQRTVGPHSVESSAENNEATADEGHSQDFAVKVRKESNDIDSCQTNSKESVRALPKA